MNRLRICSSLILISLLALTGCYKPTPTPRITGRYISAIAPQSSSDDSTTNNILYTKYVAGRSVRNRPIRCIEIGTGNDVTFMLATIHGNEPAGTPLLRKLAQYFQDNPHLLQDRKVVLLPLANPDGMALNTRFNFNGVDLNRNFSAPNRQNNARNGHRPLSEPESNVITDLIRKYNPDKIISIHQPLDCIDYDGPAKGLAAAMGQHCHLPVNKLGARPGSLGSYAGPQLGIPIITVEMLSEDSYLGSDQLWNRYGKMLLSAVSYRCRAK